MESTIKEIRKLFADSRNKPGNNCYPIDTLPDEYPAWVIRLKSREYGVAIPYDGKSVSECFNEANFQSDEFIVEGSNQRLLMLTSENEMSREEFAYFSYSLIDPGKDGKIREEITADPIEWWKRWKMLVGNSSVDKKPYDVIGELLVLKKLTEKGRQASWNGPDASTKDISSEDSQFEVKSTLSRYKKAVTISGQYQLQGQADYTYLVFNRFEKTDYGMSINSLVSDLVHQLNYPEDELEKRLKKLGYKPDMSSRNEKYSLIEQLVYRVDQEFPHIEPSSFKDDQIPAGIIRIEYTVDLDSCSQCLLTGTLNPLSDQNA